MSIALDPALANLGRKEREGGQLPLTLKRFREHCGDLSVIGAMQRAAADVLRHYARQMPRRTPRISADMLCRICEIAVEGAIPSHSRGRNTYSVSGGSQQHPGHTGAIYLDPHRSRIRLPPGLDRARARVAVAHELGHYLIHRRGGTLDALTIRLPSSVEEEALSEYAARLLLLPEPLGRQESTGENVASRCLEIAHSSDVTLHSAAARLGDPDHPERSGLKGIILWRLHPKVSADQPVPARLTPQWHLCPDVFIPIQRCHANRDSLIAELASRDGTTASGTREELVNIGSLKGSYRVEAVAWGSVRRGSRLVLAAFLER